MADIIMISAMAQNRVIGKDNQLPWHLPEDLQHFMQTTLNHSMIMGRKTFESLQGILPKRKHIVITRNKEYSTPNNVDVFYNIQDAVESAKQTDNEIYIIGGAKIYEQAFEVANKLILTVIEQEFDGDTLFPKVPNDTWQLVSTSETFISTTNNLPYRFETWQKNI